MSHDTTDTVPATLSEADARARLEKLGYPPDLDNIPEALAAIEERLPLVSADKRPRMHKRAQILRAYVAHLEASQAQGQPVSLTEDEEREAYRFGKVTGIGFAAGKEAIRETKARRQADAAQPAQGESLRCEKCRGSGKGPDCQRCGGGGFSGRGTGYDDVCYECGGRGAIGPCDACDGSGPAQGASLTPEMIAILDTIPIERIEAELRKRQARREARESVARAMSAQGASLEAREAMARAAFEVAGGPITPTSETMRFAWSAVVRAVDASRPAETHALDTRPYLVHPDEVRRACIALGVRPDMVFAEIGRVQRETGTTDTTRPAETAIQPEPECTGDTASWCPRCGDCACPDEHDNPDNGPTFDAPNCPLHGHASKHAKGPTATLECANITYACEAARIGLSSVDAEVLTDHGAASTLIGHLRSRLCTLRIGDDVAAMRATSVHSHTDASGTRVFLRLTPGIDWKEWARRFRDLWGIACGEVDNLNAYLRTHNVPAETATLDAARPALSEERAREPLTEIGAHLLAEEVMAETIAAAEERGGEIRTDVLARALLRASRGDDGAPGVEPEEPGTGILRATDEDGE